MSIANNQNSNSCGHLEHVEIVVVGSDVLYPSRADSDILWSMSPFFRVSNTANIRGAGSFRYAGGEVDENGLVLGTETTGNEEKRNPFARGLSILCLKLKVLGKRLGVVNCVPS